MTEKEIHIGGGGGGGGEEGVVTQVVGAVAVRLRLK